MSVNFCSAMMDWDALHLLTFYCELTIFYFYNIFWKPNHFSTMISIITSLQFFFDNITTIRCLTIFEFGILIWWHLRKSNVWRVNKAMALIYQSIVQISELFACPIFVCIWFRWKNYLKGFNLRPSIFPHFLLFKVFVHLRVHYCLDWFMNGPNFLCLLFCPKKNKVNNKRECILSIESSCTICTEREWNEWDVAFVILSHNVILGMYSVNIVS